MDQFVIQTGKSNVKPSTIDQKDDICSGRPCSGFHNEECFEKKNE